MDGIQHAYLNRGSIAQQLTTGLVLGETYRISALFGQPAPEDDPDSDFAAAGGSLELWAGGTVANGDVIGGELLGVLIVDEADLVGRHFVSFQTNIVAPTAGLLGGELLAIRFVSNGRESEIDNIQLFSSPAEVPEPTSLALFGLGAMGLAVHRKRHTRAS